MEKKEIKEFLINDPEGQQLFQEMTDGLKKNKEIILEEKKNLQHEYNSLMERVSALESHNQQLILEKNTAYVDSIIKKQADSMGIMEPLKDPFIKMLKTENLSIGEDNTTVYVGEKTLQEWSNEFSNSPTGKCMMPAQVNSGGGAMGGSFRDMNTGGSLAEQVLNSL